MKSLIFMSLLAMFCVLPVVGTCTMAADDDAVEAVNPKTIKADRMTLRERKELGLTVGNIRRIVTDLRAKGVTTDDPATMSVAVVNVLLEENATVYSQLDPQFDWDKFMEFIEKIVELIMKIIAIFS